MIRHGALAAFILAAAAVPAAAQVRAEVRVGAVPVYASVVVGQPVSVRRVAPYRVVVVERAPHRGRGWWRKNGYGRAIVYTDGRYYYDRWVPRPYVTQVTVYTRDGRFWTD
jgi:hypothetical protein